MCEETNIQPKRLILWIRTRWASLAQFLERFLYLKKVCNVPHAWTTHSKALNFSKALNRFVRLADDAEDVPKLAKGRQYEGLSLSSSDWDRLDLIYRVLAVLYIKISML
jgi:hypothetical protein